MKFKSEKKKLKEIFLFVRFIPNRRFEIDRVRVCKIFKERNYVRKFWIFIVNGVNLSENGVDA